MCRFKITSGILLLKYFIINRTERRGKIYFVFLFKIVRQQRKRGREKERKKERKRDQIQNFKILVEIEKMSEVLIIIVV